MIMLHQVIRGKNLKSHAIPEDYDSFIIKHILSFNPTLPHYRREQAPPRLYLSNEITVVEMYWDYCNECDSKNAIQLSKYTKIRFQGLRDLRRTLDACDV